MKNWKEAEKATCQALALNPDNTAAAISQIFALRKQRKYSEARTLLYQWLSKHPNDAALMEAKGELDLDTRKIQDAKAAFLDALRLNPNSNFSKISLEHVTLARFLPLRCAYWVLNFWTILVVIVEMILLGIEFLFIGVQFLFYLALLIVELIRFFFEAVIDIIFRSFNKILRFLRFK